MKKLLVFFLIFLIFLTGNALIISNKYNTIEDLEIRGAYISYLEYLTYFQGNSLSINKAYIKKMLDNLKSLNVNTVFLHVSPFSDSIYNSKIFPYSYTLTGTEGKIPGMDYLLYFTNEGIYYNPASYKVMSLIINQVIELITNYDIAGIHFDDYFYVNGEIDLVNYENYKLKNKLDISLTDYRLNITNSLIRNVYKTIKDYNPNLIFSISPDGNINNNYKYHFADVKTWLKEDNYVDLILPQVYYGFENEYKPFIKTLNEWHDLIQNKVKIVPVLAFYKVGRIDNQAGSGQDEWLNNHDIITRQINFSKTLDKYNGYIFFRYDFLFNPNLQNKNGQEELIKLKNINKKL